MTNPTFSRRRFLADTAAVGAACALPLGAAEIPNDDPFAKLKLGWSGKVAWGRTLDITTVDGPDWDAKLEKAQGRLAAQGGGAVYFPPGTYAFTADVRLKGGIVLRGAAPSGVALDTKYAVPSKLVFPKFEPKLSGSGTAIDTAFKGITLEDPATAARCGLVNLDLSHTHVHLLEAEGHRAGPDRFVYGCIVRSAVLPDPAVPDTAIGQHPWQRHTYRHGGAVAVYASKNILIANNRFPDSSADNFVMPRYVVKARKGKPAAFDVVFDYNNRHAIRCGAHCIGNPGGKPGRGTPESHPHGFRKGYHILDNYIHMSGRCAVSFTGDGTVCRGNVIRFEDDVFRPTATGRHATYGSSTNDNRAIEMRGWRWVVEKNDYRVYRNICSDRKYRINDGEGLMHENHCNSSVKGSRLVGNTGNAYLSIYKTEGIDDLLVEGNDMRTGDALAIMVVANLHDDQRRPCRNARILDNTTQGGKIVIAGTPGEGNVVRGNRSTGKRGEILNQAGAVVENNENYALAKK